MLNSEVHGGQRMTLIATTTITTAGTITGTPVTRLAGMKYIGAEGIFVYGSGGTAVKVYIQTSFDLGVTWVDIMEFDFALATLSKVGAAAGETLATVTTPGDGVLAANTILPGIFGDRIRAKAVTTGTYAGGTSITVYGVAKE